MSHDVPECAGTTPLGCESVTPYTTALTREPGGGTLIDIETRSTRRSTTPAAIGAAVREFWRARQDSTARMPYISEIPIESIARSRLVGMNYRIEVSTGPGRPDPWIGPPMSGWSSPVLRNESSRCGDDTREGGSPHRE